jgi:hypothetical protein
MIFSYPSCIYLIQNVVFLSVFVVIDRISPRNVQDSVEKEKSVNFPRKSKRRRRPMRPMLVVVVSERGQSALSERMLWRR